MYPWQLLEHRPPLASLDGGEGGIGESATRCCALNAARCPFSLRFASVVEPTWVQIPLTISHEEDWPARSELSVCNESAYALRALAGQSSSRQSSRRLAERVGFEPTVPFPARLISSQVR